MPLIPMAPHGKRKPAVVPASFRRNRAQNALPSPGRLKHEQ